MFYKNHTIFITMQFCIFVRITNSSFCHVFQANTAFVTFQEFENTSQNTISLLLNITIFWE